MRRSRPGAVLLAALVLAACAGEPGPTGRAAPPLAGERLTAAGERFALPVPPGEPVVVNIWASWCEPCRREHPLLMELAAAGIPVYGINHRDVREAALEWLHRAGDPFVATVRDADGEIGGRWGAGPVPQTFLLGADGIVRFHHVGPVTGELLRREILPRMTAREGRERS